MLRADEARELRALLDTALDETDAEIIAQIRMNNGQQGSREVLLSQLDVLETVRERLNVGFDRICRTGAL
jgi:hypothetical protein